MSEEWLRASEEWWRMPEGDDDSEYVVFRLGYPREPAPLEYMEVNRWDEYVKGVPDTKCVELSRGHTKAEAKNLTMLANSGEEK